MLYCLSLIFCLIYSTSSVAVKERYFTTSKTLLYSGYWGSWGSWQFCNGGYAVSFKQKVESPQDGGDDTALNGICLQCSDGREVCSSVSRWGGWATSGKCYDGFTGADFKVEGKQGEGDDTGANGLKLVCSNGQSYTTSNMGQWGSWWGYKYCPREQRICGIQTQVEANQGDDGNEDDTALNGVDLMCCGKIDLVEVELFEIFNRPADGDADSNGAKYIQQVKTTAGLLHTTGYYTRSTAAEIARLVQEVADYSAAADRIDSDHNLDLIQEVLSSALDSRGESSSVTLDVPVNVYVDVHVYVGQATITMRDGSVMRFRGDKMVKSTAPLDTSSWSVLASVPNN